MDKETETLIQRRIKFRKILDLVESNDDFVWFISNQSKEDIVNNSTDLIYKAQDLASQWNE